MAFTNPSTWVAGDVLTAAQLNQQLRDNIKFLARPPSVRVRRTTNQSINSGANTAVGFDLEEFDSNAMWSSTANTRLDFNTSGKYLFGGTVQFASSTGGTARQVAVRKSGSEFMAANLRRQDMVGGTHVLEVTGFDSFTSTQYIELMVLHDAGSSVNIEGSSAYSAVFWAIWQSS